MNQLLKDLEKSLYHGFIDKDEVSTTRLRPKLLINDATNDVHVLTTIKEELEVCDSFLFAVAFITEGGLAMLKSILWDLKERGVKGRIITSNYLNFNKPKVFRELLKLENVEVRITEAKGFHSKGYIFKQAEYFNLIVGSSNLTQSALKLNTEWNIKLASLENGEIVHHFVDQFENIWRDSLELNETWIEWYDSQYVPINSMRQIPVGISRNVMDDSLLLVPNKMQEAALRGIFSIRESGADRALIISATGTGKTYLSAFDVREFRPKTLLFIVHREQILQKAMSDFKKVLGGNDADYGIFSGSVKQGNAKYVFATQQTLQKTENHTKFDPSHFDYIIIDEAHRAASSTYQKIISYFKPKFLMGMTATPERMDNFNLYELFDYNIAYEIRLQEALEEDILCPFHYFGVSDMTVDGRLVEDTSDFSMLLTEQRVNHILEKIAYYGHSGDRVCGLIFCSRKEEARVLSSLLNERGLSTTSLTGDDDQAYRREQVKALENGEIDYILTVDIFNEGIDIPRINQVVMLRNTQSSIIFIQQLGRGLRKHPSKEYVTIIDFIGNYKNNYLVPVALSGDFSQNKDTLRRRVKNTNYIKGVSTIDFEEIAKQQIYESITNTRLTTIKLLKEFYQNLKYKLGRRPLLKDFYLNQSVDPVALLEASNNYHQFLDKVKEDVPRITTADDKYLTFLSQEFTNGKRLHEVILIEELMVKKEISVTELQDIFESWHLPFSQRILISLERILSLDFFGQIAQKKYGSLPIAKFENNKFIIEEAFSELIKQQKHFRLLVEDIIETAKLRSMKYIQEQELTIGEKYSRKDACRLLNWHSDESSTVYGYKTKHGTAIIFVTLHKKEDVDASIDYGDEFKNEQVFKWYSRSNRTLESNEVQEIIHSRERDNVIHFFVKKDDAEGTDFYYLGSVEVIEGSPTNSTMKDKSGKEIPVVTMEFLFRQTVEHDLYQYLIKSD